MEHKEGTWIIVTRGMVFEVPLRDDFTAQLVIPRNITNHEARRIGAMLLTLALDTPPVVIDQILNPPT